MIMNLKKSLAQSAAIALCATSSLLHAQDQDATPRFIRFLPLGDAPPFKQKFVNRVRHQQAAKPGTIPPQNITVPSLKGSSKSIGLELGRMTRYREFDGSVPMASLYSGAETDKPWIKTRMPTAPVTLALLLRNPKKEPTTWDNAGIRMIKDDLAAFPSNTMRVVNMSRGKVSVKLDEKKEVILKKGEIKILPLPGEKFLLNLKAQGSKRRPETLYRSSYLVSAGERVSAFVYSADGESTSRENRCKIFTEKFRMPKPAKKNRKTAGR